MCLQLWVTFMLQWTRGRAGWRPALITVWKLPYKPIRNFFRAFSMILFVPKLGLCPHQVVSYKEKMNLKLWISHHLGMWPAALMVAGVAMGMEVRSQQKVRGICPQGNVLKLCFYVPASEMRETAQVSNLADPVNETEEGRKERKRRKTNTASMCWQSRVVSACHFQDWLMASYYKLFRIVLQPLALKEETWWEVSRETPYDVVYSAVIF